MGNRNARSRRGRCHQTCPFKRCGTNDGPTEPLHGDNRRPHSRATTPRAGGDRHIRGTLRSVGWSEHVHRRAEARLIELMFPYFNLRNGGRLVGRALPDSCHLLALTSKVAKGPTVGLPIKTLREPTSAARRSRTVRNRRSPAAHLPHRPQLLDAAGFICGVISKLLRTMSNYSA